jgi:hypothetical protein
VVAIPVLLKPHGQKERKEDGRKEMIKEKY